MKIDLVGRRFNRLLVVRYSHSEPRARVWECLCDCGETTFARSGDLQNEHKRSCGCLSREMAAALCIGRMRHGETKGRESGMARSRLYSCWSGIKSRCHNPSNQAYGDYGGRGITVCDRWRESFENFKRDMGEMPFNRSLERIDNDKGYSPENCKWATRKEQNRNRRPNRMVSHNGRTLPLATWAEHFNINYWRLHYLVVVKRLDLTTALEVEFHCKEIARLLSKAGADSAINPASRLRVFQGASAGVGTLV